jgi:multidrug efflux pump subunit AcrA (membrane-fusion protein)
VEAPADGIVRTVSALSGQTVPAGAALFEVVNLDTVWVRIGVYAGDLTEIDPGMATLTTLTAHPGTPSRPAMPVAAPPTIVPQPGTADLFYAVPNPPAALAAVTGFAAVPCDGPRLSPGQRVAVAIPLNDPAQSLTVPWAAIVYDYHGGTWVYQKVGERTYSRQRVIVRYVKDDTAVLDAGPSPGAMVVTTGAAELFGTEAGFSK